MSPKKWRQGSQPKTERTWLSRDEIMSIKSGRDLGAHPLSDERKTDLGKLAEDFGITPAWKKGPEGGQGIENKR